MRNKNLFWIIPLTLFLGWTIGFYIGIPKHITFSSDDSLMELIDYAEVRVKNTTGYIISSAPNCSRVNYNITSYNTYDTGSYSKLLSKLGECNNNRELAFNILNQCKDKSWCDCDEKKPRNPIISNAIYGESNKKRFCIWEPFHNKNCGFTEMDIRNLISHMGVESTIEVMRWEDE